MATLIQERSGEGVALYKRVSEVGAVPFTHCVALAANSCTCSNGCTIRVLVKSPMPQFVKRLLVLAQR